MRATDVVAYTFRADTYHPSCVLPLVKAAHPLDYPIASTIESHATPEGILATVARSMRLDHMDEHSFDSGDFPKVVFASQVESDEEVCGACGEPIVGCLASDLHRVGWNVEGGNDFPVYSDPI